MARAIETAAATLARGGLVVYPTDTLYGIGAYALDRSAVARLLDVKRRPGGMPVSVAVSSFEELERWTRLRPTQRAMVRRLLPGAVTMLLPGSREARQRLAPGLLGPDGSLGIRIPDHPIARELARRVGPITCTSANLHGFPAPRRLRDARHQLGNGVDQYLDGRPSPSGRPSTIVDLRGQEPREVRRS